MEGPPELEEGILVGLGNKREYGIPSEMLETMHSLKGDLESIKVDSEKFLKVRA